MMEDDEKAMEAPDGPGPEFEEAQQQQGAEGGDMVEQMIQAKNDRKRAESDVQLLANRLAHLKVRELNGPTRAAAAPPAYMDVLRVAHAACAPPHLPPPTSCHSRAYAPTRRSSAKRTVHSRKNAAPETSPRPAPSFSRLAPVRIPSFPFLRHRYRLPKRLLYRRISSNAPLRSRP